MAKKKPKHPVNSSATEKRLSVKFAIPEQGLCAGYVNQMLVQSDEHAAYISFFQAQPPIVLGDSLDDVQRKLEELTEVKAALVAQVVIAKERLPEFAAVLLRVANRVAEAAEGVSQRQHSDSKS